MASSGDTSSVHARSVGSHGGRTGDEEECTSSPSSRPYAAEHHTEDDGRRHGDKPAALTNSRHSTMRLLVKAAALLAVSIVLTLFAMNHAGFDLSFSADSLVASSDLLDFGNALVRSSGDWPFSSRGSDGGTWQKRRRPSTVARRPKPVFHPKPDTVGPAISLADAIRQSEKTFSMSFENATKQLVRHCQLIHDAKYGGEPTGPLQSYQLALDWLTPSNTALQVILLVLQLQLPPHERHRVTVEAWTATDLMRNSFQFNDHNDCLAICAAAGYALLPYPLSCKYGGSMFDQSGCAARPDNVRPQRGVSSSGTAKLAVTTIFTGDDMKRGSCGLFRSACQNNVNMHVVHSDKWKGMGQKLEMIMAFLDTLAADTAKTDTRWIVMLIDGYDVLLQQSSEKILQLFFESGQNAILSSEANCFPWDLEMCDVGIKPCGLFEQGDRRFPNSGGMIADAAFLRKIMQEIHAMPADMVRHWPGTDQGLMGQLYLTQRFDGFVMDTKSEIFASHGPAFRRNMDNTKWLPGGGRWKEKLARSPPAALHFNGAGTQCFRSVEAAAPYNKGEDRERQTGSGTCELDKTNPTVVYEYDADKAQIVSTQEVLGFYESRCSGFQCNCEHCECSKDASPIESCGRQ